MSFAYPATDVFSRGDLIGTTTPTNDANNFEAQVEALFALAEAADAAARAAGRLGPALPPLSPNFINWRGAWSPTTAYSPYDAVSRDGSSYIAVGNSTDIDPSTAPDSVWNNATPGGAAAGGPYALGMSFEVTEAQYLTRFSYYRVTGETGTHTAKLYSTAGILLASAEFPTEVSLGWQYADLPTPYLLSTAETYVVSVEVSTNFAYVPAALPHTSAGGVIEAIASYYSSTLGESPYPSNPQLANYGIDITTSAAGVWSLLAAGAAGGGGIVDTIQDDTTATGETLISSESTAENVKLKTILAGANITVTQVGTGNLEIASTATGGVQSVANDASATGETLISSTSTADDVKLKELVAGANVTITPSGTGDLIIASTATGGVQSVADDESATGTTLISTTSTAEDVKLRTLKAGSHVAITPDGTGDLTLSATGVQSVGDDSTATGATLISSETTSDDAKFKTLKAGANVTVTPVGTGDIELDAVVATVADDTTATGLSLISAETVAPDYKLRTLLAGAGINIAESGTGDLTIENILPGVYSCPNIIYLDQAAPPGGDGSAAFPWQSLDECVTGFAALANGLYKLIVRPGSYTVTGDTITWPSDLNTVAIVVEGASQAMVSFNCTVVVSGDAFSFWTNSNVLTFDYQLAAASFVVLNHIAMNYNSNGDPLGSGLKLSECTAPFQIIFIVNSGLLQMETYCTVNATACSIGNWTIRAGGLAKATACFLLFGNIDIYDDGQLQTFVCNKMPSGGGVFGKGGAPPLDEPLVLPIWTTDQVSLNFLGSPTADPNPVTVVSLGGATNLNELTDCMKDATERLRIGIKGNVATTNDLGNIVIAVNALSYNVADDFVASTQCSPLALPYGTQIRYHCGYGYGAFVNATVANHSSAFGNNALATTTVSSYNSAYGSESLLGLTTAANCTAHGAGSLKNITTGDNNSALGHDAGLTITTGSENLILGRNADVSDAGAIGRIALGNGAVATVDNALFVPTTITGAAGGPVLYDAATGQIGPLFNYGVAGQALVTDGVSSCTWQDIVPTTTALLYTPDPGTFTVGNTGYTAVIIDIDNYISGSTTLQFEDGTADGQTLVISTINPATHYSEGYMTFSGANLNLGATDGITDLVQTRGFTLVWDAGGAQWSVASSVFGKFVPTGFAPLTTVAASPLGVNPLSYAGAIINGSAGNPSVFGMDLAGSRDSRIFTFILTGTTGAVSLPLDSSFRATQLNLTNTGAAAQAIFSSSINKWIPISGDWFY